MEYNSPTRIMQLFLKKITYLTKTQDERILNPLTAEKGFSVNSNFEMRLLAIDSS